MELTTAEMFCARKGNENPDRPCILSLKFVVEARHGMWLSPFSEKVKMKVSATSSKTCRVVVESSSRSILNLLNFGANKGNVSDLSDYISNEVYRLTQPGEIPMKRDGIKFR